MLARLLLATLYDLATRTLGAASMLLEQAAHRPLPAALGGLRRLRARAPHPRWRYNIAVPAGAVALLAISVVGAFLVASAPPAPAGAAARGHAAAVDHMAASHVQAAMLVTAPPEPNISAVHGTAASTVQRHQAATARARHVAHLKAVRLARERAAAAAAAAASAAAQASASATQQATAAATAAAPAPVPTANAPPVSSSYGTVLSYAQIEQVWVQAGGPAAVEATAANIAECESGGNTRAYNPSGATGLFQILGQVVPGDLYDPLVNAENAVAKFNASGGTFAQWVCQG